MRKHSLDKLMLSLIHICGADENDCDDLAGIAGKAKGSLISLTIREDVYKRQDLGRGVRPRGRSLVSARVH